MHKPRGRGMKCTATSAACSKKAPGRRRRKLTSTELELPQGFDERHGFYVTCTSLHEVTGTGLVSERSRLGKNEGEHASARSSGGRARTRSHQQFRLAR